MNDLSVRLSWPDFVYDLLALLRELKCSASLYLVGGAVRDAYLGGAVDDIDIAVEGDAIAVARGVTDAWNADIYIMDRERGVARVFVKRGDSTLHIDFARMRGPTLEDDLRDRDFTMNAMAADLLGAPDILIDPLAGAADLRRKILRRCSPRSIANDPIRVLRAVRLSAQFDLKIHPDTTSDIKHVAGEIRRSSPERIRDEFFKLLGMEKASRGLRVLGHIGVLEHVMPQLPIRAGSRQSSADEADAWSRTLAVVDRMSAMLTAISSRRTDNTAAAFDLGMLVMQLDRYRASLQGHLKRTYGNGRAHAELLILAALLHQLGDKAPANGDTVSSNQVAELARSLRLTTDEQRNLSAAIENYRVIIDLENWTRLDRHRFWYRLEANGIDAILLAVANALATQGNELKQQDWLRLVERVTILLDAYFNSYEEVVSPKLLLDGSDVRDMLNIRPGPKVGRLLTALREAQVTGAVNSVLEARDFVLRSAAQFSE